MKVSVIYNEESGSISKLAKTVGDILEINPINISAPHHLEDIDLLFIGCAIKKSKPDEAILEYIDNLPAQSIKGAAIFCTTTDDMMETKFLVNALKQKKIEVFQHQFHCYEQHLWKHIGRPNESDIQNLKLFVKEVLQAIL